MKKIALLAGTSILAISSTGYAQLPGKITGNEFNPAISLILDGRYTQIESGELELPGFQLGGEAGLPHSGFSTGHNELSISANVDDKFYGSMTSAIVIHDGETELELEEAFIETLKLGNGFTVKGGRFLSGIGYLNGIHDHAHDFADRPLVYDALVGGHLIDTGLQARWVAPTDFFLTFGAEITSGTQYPSGENEDGNKGLTLFAKTGGDFDESSSWQLGFGTYQSKFDVREAGGHHHGEEEGHDHDEEDEHDEEHHEGEEGLTNGEVDLVAIDFVYKWAPNGNSKKNNFKFQAEYFVRNEEATLGEGTYDGEQKGFYLQGVYQFMPAWRAGLRYDSLTASNKGIGFDDADEAEEHLEETGLLAMDDPKKTSIMVDYAPSHFSRIRFQYSNLENGAGNKKDIFTLQYTMSIGSHGAHSF